MGATIHQFSPKFRAMLALGFMTLAFSGFGIAAGDRPRPDANPGCQMIRHEERR